MPWFALARSLLAAAVALGGEPLSPGRVTPLTSSRTAPSMTTAPPAMPATPAASATPTAPLAAPSEVRVVTPDERRAFYRRGAKEQLGRTVHLHVEGEVLRKEPHPFTDIAGAEWVRLENREVPLLIPAKSPYWLQVRRHRDGAKEFCVRGHVRLLPGDERQRAAVLVTKLVRAPGGWR